MKTEREFIDSVYAKYELEKSRRNRLAKRNRTVYLCAGLAACFCVVVLGTIRILPGLVGTNNALEADGVMFVTATSAENYNGSPKEDMIMYSLADDAKTKLYYADEEEIAYEEECVEEAVEAPTATRAETASGTKNSPTIKQDIEYTDAEKAILNVIDCSFTDSGRGFTEIFVDGVSVGRIYTSDFLIYNSEAQVSGDLYFKPQDEVYVIEYGAEANFYIVLSPDHFTDEDVEKITASVQK